MGSTFDSWLREEGIYEEVSAAAIKRVVARQDCPRRSVIRARAAFASALLRRGSRPSSQCAGSRMSGKTALPKRPWSVR